MSTIFTVEGVTERPSLDAAGGLVNMTIVYLRTGRGARGTVEIPTDQYMLLTETEDGRAVVREMLQSKADKLEAPFEM